MKVAIYFTTGEPDVAIVRGLAQAGCKWQVSQTIGDAMSRLLQLGTRMRAMKPLRKRQTFDLTAPVLVAHVQSGALALLDMLHTQKLEMPLTMLVDSDGRDIQVALRALHFGVQDYLLPEDDFEKRQTRIRLLLERCMIPARPAYAMAYAGKNGFVMPNRSTTRVAMEQLRWDPLSHTIHIGDEDMLRLSPMEGRTFDLLYNQRGKTVSIEELIDRTLSDKAMDASKNIQLLRTHLARLRRRLSDNPQFGYRIENMRGSGYQLI